MRLAGTFLLFAALVFPVAVLGDCKRAGDPCINDNDGKTRCVCSDNTNKKQSHSLSARITSGPPKPAVASSTATAINVSLSRLFRYPASELDCGGLLCVVPVPCQEVERDISMHAGVAQASNVVASGPPSSASAVASGSGDRPKEGSSRLLSLAFFRATTCCKQWTVKIVVAR
ncbi:hypothetical protein KC367_g174 [Hortaea werneckii]|nr:hypothetical protein KC367_g174 [Hortaea werneckii]